MTPRKTTLLAAMMILSCACAKEPAQVETKDLKIAEHASMKMAVVPSGSFTMGSPPQEAVGCRGKTNEEPVDVTLTRDFLISTTEVTQAQWEAVGFPNPGLPRGSEQPVNWINWFEAAAFANALSKLEGREECYDLSSCRGVIGAGCPESPDPENIWCDAASGNSGKHVYVCHESIRKYESMYECSGYRLPTRAEFEYAARADTKTATYNGDVRTELGTCEFDSAVDEIAWYCGNADKPMPVGKKRPNPFGLYDILGNLREWSDSVKTGYNLAGNQEIDAPLVDPMGSSETDHENWRDRSSHGGDFRLEACHVRAAHQSSGSADERAPIRGFRVVRTL